jgi:ABC-type branched-subunit amino acid transport system substrate-binding protein
MAAAGVLMVGLIAISSTSGGAVTSHKKAPYKVVIVSALTGVGATNQGISAANGFEAAIKAINAGGGVKGHKISYTVLDDQSSPTLDQSVGIQAVTSHPTAILDGEGTQPFGFRLPTYIMAQEVVLSQASLSTGYPWLYSDAPSGNQGGYELYSAAKTVLGGSLQGKKVAEILVNTPGAIAFGAAATAHITADGGIIADVEKPSLYTTSFASGAANIVTSGAQVVVIADIASDGLVEAQALRAAGYTGPIAANYGPAVDISTLKDPLFSGQYLFPPPTPQMGMYKTAQKYGLLAGIAATPFAQGWVLTYMLRDALLKCGYPCNTAKLEKNLNGLGHFAIPGNTSFGQYNVSLVEHNILQFTQLYTWDTATSSVVKYLKPFTLGPGN